MYIKQILINYVLIIKKTKMKTIILFRYIVALLGAIFFKYIILLTRHFH